MFEQPTQDQKNPNSDSPNKTTLIIIGAVAILLVLGGGYFLSQRSSEKAAKKAIENTTGADVDIDGNKTIIETDEGKISIGSSEVPDSFPSDVTVYKDAEVVGSTEADDGVTLMLTTSDSITKVTDFYTKDIKDNSWIISSSSNFEESSLITAEKGNKSLLITIAPDKSSGKTSIALLVSATK